MGKLRPRGRSHLPKSHPAGARAIHTTFVSLPQGEGFEQG